MKMNGGWGGTGAGAGRKKQSAADSPREKRAKGAWGGKRLGVGRKKGSGKQVPHRVRPPHAARHPVHVTLRCRRIGPGFRVPECRVVVAKLIAELETEA